VFAVRPRPAYRHDGEGGSHGMAAKDRGLVVLAAPCRLRRGLVFVRSLEAVGGCVRPRGAFVVASRGPDVARARGRAEARHEGVPHLSRPCPSGRLRERATRGDPRGDRHRDRRSCCEEIRLRIRWDPGGGMRAGLHLSSSHARPGWGDPHRGAIRGTIHARPVLRRAGQPTRRLVR
jgi:hypothetical protein